MLNPWHDGNLTKQVVFTTDQDVRLPCIALFAKDFIPKGTELSYDYGYQEGMVEGTPRHAHCGALA